MRVLLLLATIFFSCSSSDNRILVKNFGEAQGSYFHIQYLSQNGENYHRDLDSIFLKIDSSLSIYKPYSTISMLNNGQKTKTDSLFNNVFMLARKISKETDGNFDCSVYPLVKAWGFYENNLSSNLVIDSVFFLSILKNIGFNRISLINDSLILPDGMSIDFNSIAQGYTVDLISQFLDSKGDSNYLVEVGGELRAKGRNADGEIWRVGIDKPYEEINVDDRFHFILDLEDKSLATSGNYRKFYYKDGVKYSHTINPFTGFPAHNRLLSVTVIHDRCVFADAYATAFMVMGVKKTKNFIKDLDDSLEVYLIFTDKDGKLKTYISRSMKARIIN